MSRYFLSTERLGFRSWAADDLPLARALWTDADVMRHMGGPMTTDAADTRLAHERSTGAALGFQYWPVFSLATGQHAGCAGLRPFHDRSDVLELGVHIARAFWSERVGEEAARAVIAWAWHNTQVAALVAGHGPNNVHSQALIERLGFHYTHHEPWGPCCTQHPYYWLDRPLPIDVPALRRPG